MRECAIRDIIYRYKQNFEIFYRISFGNTYLAYRYKYQS